MSIVDLTRLSDDDLRAALFDALVERLDARAREDPSIAVVNRMPTVLAVSREGNLLTLSQGLGLWLLSGVLKWRDRSERLRTFNVSRATIQSRLIITPDRIEGAPDEILDRIVAMFLEWTTTGEERPPTVAAPVPERRPTPRPAAPARQSTPPPAPPAPPPAPRSSRPENRPAARLPQDRPAPREATQAPRATSAGPTQERRPAAPRITGESRPAPVDVRPEAAPPPPAPIREVATPTLRTYQLLFETARRELDQAKAVPTANRHFLISAGVLVAFTAEAFFNDLGSRVIPSWSQLQRLDPREKAEVLNIELFNDKVDWSVRPFQSVAAALGFRRALAHAHAETLSQDLTGTANTSSEVPRTRRTAWQEHCDVATMQRWIIDVRLLIEHFSRRHDPSGTDPIQWTA